MLAQIKLLHRAWKYRLQDDAAEINYLLQTIKKGDTSFDVGAHKGGYTYWLQKAVGNSGKVIAFEPQQEGAILLRNLFQSKNIRIENKALSNKINEQLLYISPQQNSVSFEASLANKYLDSIEVIVETTTLDAYCSQHGLQPNFLKIDVEGYELEVLEGGAKTLETIRPVVLIEIEERHIGKEKMDTIFLYFKMVNYAGFFFLKGKKIALEYFESAIHQNISLLENAPKLYCNNFVFEPLP